MNKIENWVLSKFDDVHKELNGTVDEEEQAKISAEFIPLDKLFDLVKNRDIVELTVIFHKDEGCKIYNIHAEKDTHYVEEYDGFALEDEIDDFMEEAKCRDISETMDQITLLCDAMNENAIITDDNDINAITMSDITTDTLPFPE